HAASNLSYFFLMGQTGLALGPALAGMLLDSANPAGAAAVTVAPLYVLGIISLPVIGFMAIAMRSIQRPATRPAASSTPHSAEAPRPALALPVKALALLAAVVLLRSLAQPGSVAFIPRLFQQKGWDPTEYGLITSSFWIASAISGVIFGQLADRYARRAVIAASLLASVPALFFLPVVETMPLAFALAIAAGGMTGGSHSVIVALAQSLIPGSKGLASGLTLGFLFGTGAIGSFVLGSLSDQIGLDVAFQIVAGAVVIAALLALRLPAGTQRQGQTEPEAMPAPSASEAR
ncbi:MAG: MFS transporter, partial [Anaerolineae bacterium]|nr:MFS transporter [Anaerolineae bacterium]